MHALFLRDKNSDIVWRAHSAQRDKELAMRKHGFGQENTGLADRLALRLVDRNRECRGEWKLTTVEGEWQGGVAWSHRRPTKISLLTGMVAGQNSRDDEFGKNLVDDETGPVAQALGCVDVA